MGYRTEGTGGCEQAARWRGHIARQRESVLTIRAYCRAEGLSEGMFYQWRRRLAGRVAKPTPVTSGALFAEVVADGREERSGTRPSALMEVVLENGRVVRVPWHFDGAAVSRLVAALEDVKGC